MNSPRQDHLEQLASTIRSQMLFFMDSGVLQSRPHTVEEFFQVEEEERFGPTELMSGDRTVGWMWPCGSVYMESQRDRDPQVAALGARYEHLDVVASLAGAPHTLTIPQALELYRTQGWLRTEHLTVADVRSDECTMLVYRPTIVIHEIKAPERALAVGTAELRLETAGTSVLLTSATLLGMAILDERSPKAAGYFLAQVMAMHLGDISAYASYSRERIKHIVLFENPQSILGSGDKIASPAEKTAFREFDDYFAFRAISEDHLESLDDDDGDMPPSSITLHRVTAADDVAALSLTAEPSIAAAVSAFAKSGKRPGFQAVVERADAARIKFETMGGAAALRAAAAEIEIYLGLPRADSEFRSMTIYEMSFASPLIRKPLSTSLLHYSPLRDRHPFDTWDNSELGVLDTLELIHKGASHGEGMAVQTLGKLGYSSVPSECLILQPPSRKLYKTSALVELAAMMVAAARVRETPYSMLIIELPVESSPREFDDLDDRDGRLPDATFYAPLYEALRTMGFQQSSDWVYALPAPAWELALATIQKFDAWKKNAS